MRRTMLVACATILSLIALPVAAADRGAIANANPAARLAVADDGPSAPGSAVKKGSGHGSTAWILGGLAAAGVIAGAVALGSHGSSPASN